MGTAQPTVPVFETSGLPLGLYTESDDLYWLALGLAPVAVIVLIVWFARQKRWTK